MNLPLIVEWRSRPISAATRQKPHRSCRTCARETCCASPWLRVRSRQAAPRLTRLVRLERGLWRDRIVQRARRIAAVAILVGFGWLAHAEVGQLGIGQVGASALPPAYVTDAVMAHRATLVRASMHSQRGASAYDAAEIRATTAIVLPTLPQGWQVADVQIFPSTFGPSVEMVIRSELFGTGSLFAVRPGKFDVVPPTLAHKDDFTIAYWQVGEVAYALVAKAEPRDLSEVATGLATSLATDTPRGASTWTRM